MSWCDILENSELWKNSGPIKQLVPLPQNSLYTRDKHPPLSIWHAPLKREAVTDSSHRGTLWSLELLSWHLNLEIVLAFPSNPWSPKMPPITGSSSHWSVVRLFLNFCHGPLWQSDEAYGPCLRIIFLNAKNKVRKFIKEANYIKTQLSIYFYLNCDTVILCLFY